MTAKHETQESYPYRNGESMKDANEIFKAMGGASLTLMDQSEKASSYELMEPDPEDYDGA